MLILRWSTRLICSSNLIKTRIHFFSTTVSKQFDNPFTDHKSLTYKMPSNGENSSELSPSQMVDNARRAFATDITKDVAFRREQLEKLDNMLVTNENVLAEAIKQDLRKPYFEAILTEIEFVRNEIHAVLNDLESWAKPQKVSKSLMTLFDSVYLHPEPYGVTLIIGAWNYPLMLTLCPVVGAIASGNTVIIKPSELSSATAKVLAALIPRYLDQDCYQVFLGGPQETAELVKQKFDYIFYTGSSRVGKLIYLEAAKNLTPVTLELGGKSPLYFDDSADNNLAAIRRLVWGKFVNNGQTCVAPDYILCSRKVQASLLKQLPQVIEEFYSNDVKNHDDYGRIININHFKRIVKLMEDNKGKIVIGGNYDEKELFIEPTVMSNVSPDDSIMQDEIFGPILPIVVVDSADDAIQFINNREKPLSLYIFSKNQSIVDKFSQKTSSGAISVNDCLIHLSVDSLPFGGVGNSGIGRYRGKFSFDTFTHYKSVLHRGYNFILEALGSHRYPPYTPRSMTFMSLLTRKRWF
ncbi:aldehyde dehydrogenase, dimeric NADP-preferring-like [Panonychus citri]|uniref:aldehyde dehydrogenase, dimeric NADP-preferring-like n=1 Tax=Panonychus citri TaxID=50023 RepID=UPI002306E9D6|nr:aldehyde dehydrogenase, dimeric NADP-preferring-like [Panonychus citri]XP_053207713.1 aldehyde dehydrogenase, dimeric NADP-preferring-like [Panonychus citri]